MVVVMMVVVVLLRILPCGDSSIHPVKRIRSFPRQLGERKHLQSSCELQTSSFAACSLLHFRRVFSPKRCIDPLFVVVVGILVVVVMPGEDFLGKKYKLASSENFDEFLKALGVGMVTRKMGTSISPVVELTENNGLYTLKTTSTFKNSEIKFKLGEEFDEETPDGRKVKSVCTLEGNKLTQIQKGDKNTTIIREFGPTEMKAIMTVDDIVCTRVYKVQE